MTSDREIDEDGLAARIEAMPGFAVVSSAAERLGLEAWVVGGAVRDSLLVADTAVPNLDVVVAGDPLALAQELGGEVRVHERFNTATAYLPEGSIDVAMARAESYSAPGALPEVRPAGIDEDLARRDFTVNALAVSLSDPGAVIDHHRGRDDLRAGLLRVLHDGSFVDDPTRALRAARYAARLGFEVEPVTLAQLVDSDLATVSTDRVDGELERLAAEPEPARALQLLHDWDLIALEDGEIDAFAAAAKIAGEPRWRGSADLGRLLVELVRGDLAARARLLAGDPGSASAGVEQAGGRSGEELLLARALGGEWLDRYVDEWRGVRLEISGDDLIAAGIPQGPAIGRGLAAALRAKLDGGAAAREDEMRIALDAARE
jgi:tRNA nucleotidyltransferase (CCA-adding enzyme)